MTDSLRYVARVAEKNTRSTMPHGCRGKVRYPKRKQALGAVSEYRAMNPEDPDLALVVAYRCPHGCHGWHIGHDRKLVP